MTATQNNLARADAALAEARAALTEGRVEEAVASAQEAVGAAPDYAPAIAGLAVALKRAGRDAEARRILTHVSSDVLGRTGDRVEMAAFCLREGVAEPAMEILRTTLEKTPSDGRAAELLARAYLTGSDFSAVIAVCEPFRARGQATPTLLRLLAAGYERLGDLPAARECAYLYTESAPLDPRGHYHLATLEHRLGSIADAMDRYDLTIELANADNHLAKAAGDGIRALDALQLRQISAMAGRDTAFRIALQHDMQQALEDRGFVLSDEGLALLSNLDIDAFDDLASGGSRYH